MLLISELSMILPFAMLKLVRPKDMNDYSFMIYIWFATSFQFFFTLVYLHLGISTILLHVYTPFEFGFFLYILFTLYEDDHLFASLFSPVAIVAVFLIDFISSYKEIDYSSVFIECFVLIIVGVTVLIKAIKERRLRLDCKLFFLFGILFFAEINLFSFPSLNMESNITMNIFFTIGMFYLWLKNERK